MTHAKLKLRFGLNEGGSGVAKLRARAAYSDSVRPSVPCQRMGGPSRITHPSIRSSLSIRQLAASCRCEVGRPRLCILYSPWEIGEVNAVNLTIVRLSYAPIGVVSLGIDLVSSVPPLVRTALFSRHPAFPLPRRPVLCPCLDSVHYMHHTPSSSYLTSTSCFCQIYRLARRDLYSPH